MVRTGPSRAEGALLDHLRSKGLRVSAAQLERWRLAGVLPKNDRKYLGRGKGSTSDLSPVTVDIAEAMAMTVRRGRSLHEAVLRIFTVDPRHNDLFVLPGIQLPERSIRAAMDWFIESGDQSLDRRIERALKRASGADEAAETVYRLAIAHFHRIRVRPESLQRLSDVWHPRNDQDAQNLAWVTIGRFVGIEEVGSERWADIIMDRVGEGKEASEVEIRKEVLKAILIDREISGENPVKPFKSTTSEDVRDRLASVDIARIREARDKIAFVSEMGNYYLYLQANDFREPFAARMRGAVNSSIDGNMLFHALVPIADVLTRDPWHRMAAALTMILTQEDGDYVDESYGSALDRLAAAAAPDRFG